VKEVVVSLREHLVKDLLSRKIPMAGEISKA
jgi:hypothetical protein